MKNKPIRIQKENVVYYVFKTSNEAWDCLTKSAFKLGWRIGCYGAYENCLYNTI